MWLFLLQRQEVQIHDIESNCLVTPALDSAAKVRFLPPLKLLLDRANERIREDRRIVVKGYGGGCDLKLDARDQVEVGDKAPEDQRRGKGP